MDRPQLPIFTGNISINDTIYDPDPVVLQAMRDAAEAEFPGIVNIHVPPGGPLSPETPLFKGRYSR